jgi:nucleotide-binding universal stress UspA family protein
MKILFGLERELDPAFSLLKQLHFPEATVDIVHVVAPINYALADPINYLAFGIEPLEVDRMVAERDKDANRSVAEAMASLSGTYPCQTMVLFGQPAYEILKYSDEQQVDIIAINAGYTESEGVAAVMGSVSCALVAGASQSVLVARNIRNRIEAKNPLRVVFATDHSDYANRCFEEFLRLAPTGIGHLAVICAYPKDSLGAMQMILPPKGVNIANIVHKELTVQNETMLAQAHERLVTRVLSTASYVLPDPVYTAIDHVMEAEEGDILVLGAKGHGLLERLTMGSVSMHQAIAGKYSTLIIRA